MSELPLKLIFIGGYGRSGTTLLDLVLGQLPGVQSLGEVRGLLSETVLDLTSTCGCGADYQHCEFWRSVGELAFGGWDAPRLSVLHHAQSRADRWWRIPSYHSRLKRRTSMPSNYINWLRDVYRAAGEVAQASTLIDSSKGPAHGYLLQFLRQDFDIYTVHLIRDSRGATHSWSRHPKFDQASQQYFEQRSLPRSSAEWLLVNALVTSLNRWSPCLRIRYEDFVVDPETTIAKIVKFAGLRTDGPSLAGSRTIEMRENHLIAGNPIRFQRGPVQLSLDDRWLEAFDLRSRLTVTGLTSLGLLRYGYRLR